MFFTFREDARWNVERQAAALLSKHGERTPRSGSVFHDLIDGYYQHPRTALNSD